MTPEERRLFARHLSIAEIGVAGQLRILGSRVQVADGADARVARWALEYATRAGARFDAGAAPIASATPFDVQRIAGRPELEDAAALFLGALGALDHLRRTVLGGDVRPMEPIMLAPAPPAASDVGA